MHIRKEHQFERSVTKLAWHFVRQTQLLPSTTLSRNTDAEITLICAYTRQVMNRMQSAIRGFCNVVFFMDISSFMPKIHVIWHEKHVMNNVNIQETFDYLNSDGSTTIRLHSQSSLSIAMLTIVITSFSKRQGNWTNSHTP